MEEKRQPFDSAQDKLAPALQKVSCHAVRLRRRTLQLPGLQYTSAVNQALRIWHPFTHSKLDPPPLQVERGEGVYLCTKDGKKILDAISSGWGESARACGMRFALTAWPLQMCWAQQAAPVQVSL